MPETIVRLTPAEFKQREITRLTASLARLNEQKTAFDAYRAKLVQTATRIQARIIKLQGG